jgi:hypothetical protein
MAPKPPVVVPVVVLAPPPKPDGRQTLNPGAIGRHGSPAGHSALD